MSFHTCDKTIYARGRPAKADLSHPSHRHLDALHVFIHTLNRFDEAEAYCDRVYSKQQEQLRLQQQQLSGQRDQKDKANSTALPEHPVRLSWMTDVREQLSVDQRFNIYLLLIQVSNLNATVLCDYARSLPVCPVVRCSVSGSAR